MGNKSSKELEAENDQLRCENAVLRELLAELEVDSDSGLPNLAVSTVAKRMHAEKLAAVELALSHPYVENLLNCEVPRSMMNFGGGNWPDSVLVRVNLAHQSVHDQNGALGPALKTLAGDFAVAFQDYSLYRGHGSNTGFFAFGRGLSIVNANIAMQDLRNRFTNRPLLEDGVPNLFSFAVVPIETALATLGQALRVQPNLWTNDSNQRKKLILDWWDLYASHMEARVKQEANVYLLVELLALGKDRVYDYYKQAILSEIVREGDHTDQADLESQITEMANLRTSMDIGEVVRNLLEGHRTKRLTALKPPKDIGGMTPLLSYYANHIALLDKSGLVYS